MTFNEIIQQDKPVLVDFFATWCGPCNTMMPILDQVKNNVGETASILKIDIDKNPKAAAVYRVQSVPTFILFKKGKILWRQSGVVAAKDLEQLIKSNM